MQAKADTTIVLAGKGINGLANIGNTCYINTSVQCLGHCMAFLKFALETDFRDCKTPLMTEFKSILAELWVNDNGIIPNRFLNFLRQHIKGIFIFEQNDIQEFLTIFIDKLNHSISRTLDIEKTLANITYDNNAYDKLRKKLDRSWMLSMHKEYSPLVDLFYGQSVVQVICGHCQKIHHNYEPFSVLLLPIPQQQSGVEDCLTHYCCEEHLNDCEHTVWKCDGCNKSERSLKTMKFWRMPRVLIICLKRFTWDLRKNDVQVDVPHTLDMSEFVIGQATPAQYTLKSVACHSGNFHNGHYWALCKNPNGKWYRLDDTMIYPMTSSFEMPSSAYLLFYEASTI